LKKALIIIILVLASGIKMHAQSTVSFSGYLNDMQTVYHLEDQGWLWENQVHNRLNLDIYPAGWLKMTLHGRSRFLQGKTYSGFPGYAGLFKQDAGWIDLTAATSGSYNDQLGYILTTTLDRASAEFTWDDFVGTVGRQRINWGQTFVWNPNDIFNAYSYFDVDYPERPGSDAVRLQYYTGMTSNIEVAASIDSANQITAAGYFRMNTFGYDIQFIAGILDGEDLLMGTGWSGSVVNTSFRGEATWFRDLENFTDTTGYLLLSAGLDHTMGNGLWLQSEVLYSGFAKELKINNFLQLFSTGMNVKNIGFTRWALFGSISYPVTPLFDVSLSGIFYPEWKGFYLGPNLEISVTNNIRGAFIFQAFTAELENFSGQVTRQNTLIGYARIKWSF